MKKKLLTVLLFCAVFFMPHIMRADDVATLANQISNFTGGGTGSLTAVASGNTVTVTGSLTGVTTTLYLDIDTDITVDWHANISELPEVASNMEDLVFLFGTGTFEITEGSISTTYAYHAIAAYGKIIVNGGEVIGRITSNSSITVCGTGKVNGAIWADNIEVTGGEVLSYYGPPIYSSDDNSTVTISGGKVISSGFHEDTTTPVKNSLRIGGIEDPVAPTESAIITSGNSLRVPQDPGFPIESAIITSGNSSRVTISGGMVFGSVSGNIPLDVNPLGNKPVITCTGNNSTVTVTGGTVRTTNGEAISASGVGSSVSVIGGLVFAFGGSIANVIPFGFTDATGTGVVIAWNQATGNISYIQGSSEDISQSPETAIVKWDISGSSYGISYANGTNTGFIPLNVTATKAVSSACDIVSIESPAGATIFGDSITASVANGVMSQAIALTTSPSASWKLFNDAACTSEITDSIMPLSVGENTAYIQVTAEDGAQHIYVITVNRAAPSTIAVTGVTLNLTSGSLDVDSTLQLSATVLPDNATYQSIIWSSSNDSIATVSSNGLVTALAQGPAIITVTVVAADNSIFSATCAITVTWPIVFVSGVILNLTSDSLDVGSTLQLEATVLPDSATNKKVSWSSSDPTIASVDSTGKVSALAAGTATITVSTVDGNKTTACALTVTSSTVPVTGVTLDNSSASLWVVETMQLTATVNPTDATNQNVSWSSSNPAVATVSKDGLITAVGKGIATVTVTTEDGGYKANCSVEVLQQEVTLPDSTQTEPGGKGKFPLSLTIPTDVLFSGSFLLTLPNGVLLDSDSTRLVSGLAAQLSLTITQKSDSSWLFTIVPLGLRSATELVYSQIVEIGYIVGATVAKGTYDATVSDLLFKFNDGSTADETELPIKLTVSSTTGISDVTAKTDAYLFNGRLYIDSPVAEKITVYSESGVLLYNFTKPAGIVIYTIDKSKGSVLIVKGDSGWIRKVIR